nr:hypothetical protein Iba_chr05dCG1030 [Ipomoea batatas]
MAHITISNVIFKKHPRSNPQLVPNMCPKSRGLYGQIEVKGHISTPDRSEFIILMVEVEDIKPQKVSVNFLSKISSPELQGDEGAKLLRQITAN